MGMEGGAPLLSPLGMQGLPAGTVSGLLAANRALAVLALRCLQLQPGARELFLQDGAEESGNQGVGVRVSRLG